MIDRPIYLEFLHRWKNKNVIKVVSGVRRCGKSTLFQLFINDLRKTGISNKQIIALNFEDIENSKYLDYLELNKYLLSKLQKNKMNYIFLDEIQHVNNFQKIVDSIYLKNNVDIYITGSNSFFMSSELATLLTGRYVELKMLPLSFKEYCSYFKHIEPYELFFKYIKDGSFPYLVNLNTPIENKEYMEGILNTILLNDVIPRKKISNVPYLKNVLSYLSDNIGNMTSVKKICDTMISNKLPSNNVTLANYIEGLEESLLIYKINRFDISGKTRLVQTNKYYLCDLAFRYQILGHINDLGRIIENVVFLELIRRYNNVYIGKIGDKEVDFVVQNKQNRTEYYQVCLNVDDQKTLNREISGLKIIKDNNKKTLIVYKGHNDNIDGIEIIPLFDWLLN